MESRLYYECHITIEPVFEARLEQAKAIAKIYKFRAADLLMKKRVADTPVRSKHDTFMTGHSKSFEDIVDRAGLLVEHLERLNYQVWRVKIEDTLLDTKHGDSFNGVKASTSRS